MQRALHTPILVFVCSDTWFDVRTGIAGALAHGQAVRNVLLQLLCDGDAICAAFQAALTTATASPEFAALEAARGGAAVDVAGNVVPERRLRAVAAELDEGLIVGAGSALERILQVRLVTH